MFLFLPIHLRMGNEHLVKKSLLTILPVVPLDPFPSSPAQISWMSAGFRSSSLILQDVRWQLVFLNDAVIPLLTLALGWYVIQVVCGCVAPPWCGMYVWCGMWYVCPLSSYPHHKHPFSDPIPNHILHIGVLCQDHVPWWC